MKKNSLSTFENIRRRIVTYKNWYKIVFPFNRFFTGIQKLELRNGKSAYVRDIHSVDAIIVSSVLGDNEYDIEGMHLPKDAVVVDLGGNIGTFAMEIHRVSPAARIISYEPYPQNCAMFRINAPFATLVQKAATGKTGVVHFEDSAGFFGLQVINEGGISVEAECLDDILKDIEYVDLLKIDIEGSEYELLDNASPKTFNKIEKIVMETHGKPGIDDLEWGKNIFLKHGFAVTSISKDWTDLLGMIQGEKKHRQ